MTLTPAAMLALWSLAASPAVPTAQAPPLPELSAAELETIDPTIRTQLSAALADARETPGPETVGRLALVLHAYEQFDRAAACYDWLRTRQPRELRWAYFLGLAHAAAGRTAPAIESLRAALALDPTYLPARLRLGELLLGQGEWAEARREFDAVLATHPESAVAHHGLGRARSGLGEIEPAMASHRRAAELAPNFGAAHYALALLYRDRGDPERARDHLARYRANQARRPPLVDPLGEEIDARKGGPFHLLEEGRKLNAGNRPREAAAMFEKALELRDDLVQAHVNLISAYGVLGEFERAEQHFRKAQELGPGVAEGHYNFGIVLLSQQRFAEAEAAFRRAVAISPAYPDAHNNLGYLLLRDRRVEEAITHLEAALETDPQHRDARFNLAQALLGQERFQEAIAHLARTVAVEDDRTAIFMFYLAEAYARSGQVDQARRHAGEARSRAAASGQHELVRHIDRLVAALNKPSDAR